MREILVTGAAAVTPLGRDLETTAARLAAGESAVVEVSVSEGGERKGAAYAARIGAFTTEPELPKAKARRLDRGSQFAVVAVTPLPRRRGVDDGGQRGGDRHPPRHRLGRRRPPRRARAADGRRVARGGLAVPLPLHRRERPRLVRRHRAEDQGPERHDHAEGPGGAERPLLRPASSSTDGRAKAIVVGAVDEWNLTYQLAYERLRVLKTPSKPGLRPRPRGAPSSSSRTRHSARARGARPWARLAGAASAGSPVSPQRRRARPEDVAATIRAALADAGLPPSRVGLVHASANGVPWVDAAEEAALADVFGTAPRVERVKLQVGENPCSGALQLALAARALREEPALGAVLVNALGAGGNQITVVLDRAVTANATRSAPLPRRARGPLPRGRRLPRRLARQLRPLLRDRAQRPLRRGRPHPRRGARLRLPGPDHEVRGRREAPRAPRRPPRGLLHAAPSRDREARDGLRGAAPPRPAAPRDRLHAAGPPQPEGRAPPHLPEAGPRRSSRGSSRTSAASGS